MCSRFQVVCKYICRDTLVPLFQLPDATRLQSYPLIILPSLPPPFGIFSSGAPRILSTVICVTSFPPHPLTAQHGWLQSVEAPRRRIIRVVWGRGWHGVAPRIRCPPSVQRSGIQNLFGKPYDLARYSSCLASIVHHGPQIRTHAPMISQSKPPRSPAP